ncbi:MAG: tetratricopeptide repeat protein [Pirellulales bacterium]
MTSPRIQLALALAAALLAAPAAAALADEAGDQFAVAAGHYAARRWELAAEEFQTFLTNYPEHAKRTKALFFCAEALVQTGKFGEAQRHFAAVIEAQDSRHAVGTTTYGRQALFRAGECAFWANQPEQARVSLAQFRQQYADDRLNAYVLSYLGELALRAGDAAAAKTHYRDAMARFPDGPTVDDCRLGLAQAQLRLDEHRQAEETLAPLVQRDGQAVAANYWLGQVCKAQQQWDRAAEAFQAAIAADPAHRGMETLRYQAAESLLRAERFQAAIDVVRGGDQAAESKSPPAAHAYLVALAQQGLGQHDDALATLDVLAAKSDEELGLNVRLARATSLLALRRHREAIEPLNQYLAALNDSDADGRSRALAQLALCHARTKDFDAAKATLNQLTAAAPRSELAAATTLQLAEIAAAANQTAWAISLYEAAASEQSTADIAADALLALAQMAVAATDLEKGTSLYEQLLQQYPNCEQAVEAALACARLRERLEQYDAALAMYDLVIEKHAEAERLPEALLRAATICDRLAQDSKALVLYARLIEQFNDSPQVPAAIYGWAWSLRDLNREAEANEKFEELRGNYRASKYWPDATYRLAISAAQSKNFDRATELLDELIEAADKGTVATAADSDADDAAQVTVSDEVDSDTMASTSDETASRVSSQILQHALYLRAQIGITQRTWDGAKRDLERLVDDYSTSPLALPAEFLRADVAYRRGENDEAGVRFAELTPRLKGRDDPWIPMVALRRAQLLAHEKRWGDVRAMAKRIAEDYPTFDQQYEADYLIGRAYAAEANLAEARQWYQKVVRSPAGGKTETAAMAQWMIGESYFLQEQYADAIREYLRVEVLYAYPHWQAAALLQAGKCYEQTGQWKNAGDAYGRLLARYSQTEFAAEARQRLPSVQSRTASRTKR